MSPARELLDMPGNELVYFQWNAPILSVYFDNADTLAMLAALDRDPIMAPE